MKALYRRLIYHFPPDGARPKHARLSPARPELCLSAVSVPVMACGPSSEGALRRGPSYDLRFSLSWCAARAGLLSICLSCFIAPAMARGLSSERALRRRPSSHFPLCLISVPVMARGPSSERALRRGPSYDVSLPHSWRAARAGPLSICLSCFIAPAVARGLSLGVIAPQVAQLSFPFMLDFGASHPVCKRAPRAGDA